MRVTDIPIQEVQEIGGLKAVKELLKAQAEEEEADAYLEHLEEETLADYFAQVERDEYTDADDFDPYDYAGTCERMKLNAKDEELEAHNELTESLIQLCRDAQEFGALAYENMHSTETADMIELAAYANTVAETFNKVLAAYREYNRAEEFKKIAEYIAEVAE